MPQVLWCHPHYGGTSGHPPTTPTPTAPLIPAHRRGRRISDSTIARGNFATKYARARPGHRIFRYWHARQAREGEEVGSLLGILFHELPQSLVDQPVLVGFLFVVRGQADLGRDYIHDFENVLADLAATLAVSYDGYLVDAG